MSHPSPEVIELMLQEAALIELEGLLLKAQRATSRKTVLALKDDLFFLLQPFVRPRVISIARAIDGKIWVLRADFWGLSYDWTTDRRQRTIFRYKVRGIIDTGEPPIPALDRDQNDSRAIMSATAHKLIVSVFAQIPHGDRNSAVLTEIRPN